MSAICQNFTESWGTAPAIPTERLSQAISFEFQPGSKFIAVAGGAGYIGSHVVLQILADFPEHNVVVIDNLSTGHHESVIENASSNANRVALEVIDVRNRPATIAVLRHYAPEAIIHLCADSLVGESMQNPLKYYNNNVGGAITLLEAMEETGVERIVFSSTAAIFGEPDVDFIDDDAKQNPTNTYGETKLAIEKMLRWNSQIKGVKYVALRYFNAAGAAGAQGVLGEDHNPETHLIPNILFAAQGRRDKISIFGTDYPTPDGTCVRDYIHVLDLAEAHVLAVRHLLEGGESNYFNLGSGNGYSVKEVIEQTKSVTGVDFKVEVGPRRAGDPPRLVATSEKAKRVLGWKPSRDLESILADAWTWHKDHPQGY